MVYLNRRFSVLIAAFPYISRSYAFTHRLHGVLGESSSLKGLSFRLSPLPSYLPRVPMS